MLSYLAISLCFGSILFIISEGGFFFVLGKDQEFSHSPASLWDFLEEYTAQEYIPLIYQSLSYSLTQLIYKPKILCCDKSLLTFFIYSHLVNISLQQLYIDI